MERLTCYMSSTHMNCKDNWIDCIDRAKEMGFDGVELFSDENGVNLVDMSEDRCMEIALHAKSVDMRISAHPWVFWEHLPEDELISRYRALIERCIRMGIKEINMHLAFLASRSQGMQRVFAATDACIDLLKASGTILLYENIPEHGERELGSETIDFDRLFAHYGPESNIMLNIDSGHAHIMHQLAPLAEDYGDRWRYTHIDDNDGLSDLHTAPGAGTMNFAALARAARNADYSGVVMMEYHENVLRDGIPVLEKAYADAGYALAVIRC